MLPASKNWSAMRLSIGTPGSAACQLTPSYDQAYASPPACVGLPPAQPLHCQDMYTIGLAPSSSHCGGLTVPVGCRTASNGRSAVMPGLAKHFLAVSLPVLTSKRPDATS